MNHNRRNKAEIIDRIPLVPLSPLIKMSWEYAEILAQTKKKLSVDNNTPEVRASLNQIYIDKTEKLDQLTRDIQSVQASSFFDFNIYEIAKEIAYIDCRLFQMIVLDNKSLYGLNVKPLLDFHQYLSHSFAHQVIYHNSKPTIIIQLIQVAYILLHIYRDFSGCTAILISLQMPEVQRLHIWSECPLHFLDIYKALTTLLSPDRHFEAYHHQLGLQIAHFQNRIPNKSQMIAIPFIHAHFSIIKELLQPLPHGIESEPSKDEYDDLYESFVVHYKLNHESNLTLSEEVLHIDKKPDQPSSCFIPTEEGIIMEDTRLANKMREDNTTILNSVLEDNILNNPEASHQKEMHVTRFLYNESQFGLYNSQIKDESYTCITKVKSSDITIYNDEKEEIEAFEEKHVYENNQQISLNASISSQKEIEEEMSYVNQESLSLTKVIPTSTLQLIKLESNGYKMKSNLPLALDKTKTTNLMIVTEESNDDGDDDDEVWTGYPIRDSHYQPIENMFRDEEEWTGYPVHSDEEDEDEIWKGYPISKEELEQSYWQIEVLQFRKSTKDIITTINTTVQ
ncbi:uncharacterized protein BX663DRAFT_544587 [Cokeromyces recurvatus]|uniref:uncharacterized protein n=1 Tax=Cokeromyces recurvatus TaxID=90255 RepID=UPI00222113DD|nr:uncharacterized protein BX663DRAFT_544587 [Cokeromyces recurvatus]KAI7901073.1 hypothetical protein BX663DRAFT_544587 [Cokeromyces recurvatus]